MTPNTYAVLLQNFSEASDKIVTNCDGTSMCGMAPLVYTVALAIIAAIVIGLILGWRD